MNALQEETITEEYSTPAENRVRVVWMLAWPAVALNSLQVVNNLLDRGFIGRLPPSALTAQGGSINIVFLLFSLVMAFGVSSTALVSRAFGAREIEEYRLASRECVSLAILVSIGLAFLTVWSAPYIAYAILPNKNTEAIRLMTGFLRIFSIGLAPLATIQTLAGALRGVGDTKSPMVISGLQILLHMMLNVLLIFPTRQVYGITLPGAGMGLLGAATAMSISTWISATAYIIYSAKTPLGPQWKFVWPGGYWARRILRIVLPSATMAVLRVTSLTMFTLVLASTSDGSTAIAAMSVGFGIESIMFMPSFGLANAASALVGQSLGMKRPDRAESLAWIAGNHGALVTGTLAAVIFFGANAISHVLLPAQPETAAAAATLIRYLCVTEVLFAYAMVMIGALQGAGDAVSPMWISIIAMWGIRVPMAFCLALPAGFHLLGSFSMPLGLGLGAPGAWMAMTFTQGVQGLMAMAVFKRGAWKLKKV